MGRRQQLVRALVNEITGDIDEQAREIVLIFHWKGGQYSELRLRKPAPVCMRAALPTTSWRLGTLDDAVAVRAWLQGRLARCSLQNNAGRKNSGEARRDQASVAVFAASDRRLTRMKLVAAATAANALPR